MSTVTFPPRANIPQHSSWSGPAYLQGTWEDTGVPCPIIMPAGTVAFWGDQIWICAGGSDWAYVAPDGKIQAFVHYTMPREEFTEAKRTDVALIVPMPMTSLPPQGYKGIQYSTVLAPASSRWNGTCPRCGRGTYTGAWDVEHEGGGCG